MSDPFFSAHAARHPKLVKRHALRISRQRKLVLTR